MNLFIITPSYNQCAFLKRCVASVRDQVGSFSEQRSDDRGQQSDVLIPDLRPPTSGSGSSISVHHHVQDAGSTDGTVAFLQEQEANSSDRSAVSYTFSYESAPDNGMYDAVSKGWRRAVAEDPRVDGRSMMLDKDPLATNSHQPSTAFSGNNPRDSVIAYLNCDEQYLPRALDQVSRWFKAHPDKDVLFGDVLIVDEEGKLICGRKMVSPSKFHIMTDQLPLFTGAMFIRTDALRKYDLFPDPEWKNIGDVELVLRMMTQGVRIGLLGEYTTVFTETGSNKGLDEIASLEYGRLRSNAPWIVQKLRFLWILLHRIHKILHGCYRLPPVEYALYMEDLARRSLFIVDKPEAKWRSRLERTQ